MTELFPAQRVCVVCGQNAPRAYHTPQAAPVPILGLYVTIYRRAARGRQLAGSGRVNVCEPCLLKIAAEGSTHRADGRRLADALLSAIAKRVAAMRDEEPRRRQSVRPPKGSAA